MLMAWQNDDDDDDERKDGWKQNDDDDERKDGWKQNVQRMFFYINIATANIFEFLQLKLSLFST